MKLVMRFWLHPDGWDGATDPVWVSCVVVVRTFADMMRLAKIGPTEATELYGKQVVFRYDIQVVQ